MGEADRTPVRTVGALVDALDARFPFAWADEWDNVGLITGRTDSSIAGVLVTLDATAEAVRRAVAAGRNVLVTHHPPFLEPPGRIVEAPGASGALALALRHDVALISAHTNLDRSPEGAEALPLRLGLDPHEPLERGVEQVALVVTYAAPEHVEAVRQAMRAAGAGRIGQYEGCAHATVGTGWFEPGPLASPRVPGGPDGVVEHRIEMMCARAAAPRVMEAARSAHPYEEPVVLALDAVRSRGLARLGRISTWETGGTVEELARHVARTLGTSVRVWGDPERDARRCATANGSGTSLLSDAIGRADVFVTGEVRYHDALDATANGLAIIEAGHDATEWPLVWVLAQTIELLVSPDVPVTSENPAYAYRTLEAPHDRR
jgi:dinuclear metal center YbgI/SA1388 family protein